MWQFLTKSLISVLNTVSAIARTKLQMTCKKALTKCSYLSTQFALPKQENRRSGWQIASNLTHPTPHRDKTGRVEHQFDNQEEKLLKKH